MTGWLSDIKSITAVVAVIVSVLALTISLRSSNTSRNALRISQAQEARRLRKVVGNLIEAQFDVDKEYIYYRVSISISNPSDNSNAVSDIELWIDYHKDTNRLTLKMPPRPTVEEDQHLKIPLRLESGNTIVGDIAFRVPRELIQPNSIDGYRLAIIDTHKSVSLIGFSLAQRAPLNDSRPNETG